MRKILALGLLIAIFVLGERGIYASPMVQAIRAVITSPSMNAIVRGQVLIQGSATHPNFWKYEIHVAPEPNPQNRWQVIGVHETQVVDGVLETWQTTAVPDGSYSLLLRVVDKTGNYQEYFVRQVSVANKQPTETPTPTITLVPTMTPSPKPTSTVLVIQPTVDIAASTPTPTLERPTRPPAVTVPSLDLEGWRDAFLTGAGAMGAIFVLVGLVYLIRRIL